MKLLIVLLVRLTSLAINPVTLSLNVAVTKNGAFVVVGDADAKATVGTTVSTTMALLLAKDCPAGIVNVVALFPAASLNVAPTAKVIPVELRSVLFCPAAGVYVPTADVPVKGAIATVPPVSKATVMLPPAKVTASLKLTVTLMLLVVP